MIYRMVTWGRAVASLYHRDISRQILLESGVAHIEIRSQHAARHENVVGVDDNLSQVVVACLLFCDSIFEVGFVSADSSFIGVVVNVGTQNYESVVEIVALHRMNASDFVDGVGGVNPILLG